MDKDGLLAAPTAVRPIHRESKHERKMMPTARILQGHDELKNPRESRIVKNAFLVATQARLFCGKVDQFSRPISHRLI